MAAGQNEFTEIATEVLVDLPLSSAGSKALARQLESLSRSAEQTTVLLRFRPAEAAGENNELGEGLAFEEALTVARSLANGAAARLRSIAVIESDIRGHECLIALAARHIAMRPGVDFGPAAGRGQTPDQTITTAYREIAALRPHIPPLAASGLVDSSEAIVRYRNGQQWELAVESDVPRATVEQEIVQRQGEYLSITAERLQGLGWIDLVADSSQEVLRRYQLAGLVRVDLPKRLADPRAAMFEFFGPIDRTGVTRCLRILSEAEANGANTFILTLDAGGGDLTAAIDVANRMIDLSSRGHQTIVYSGGDTVGAAALIAMSADRFFCRPETVFGGPSSLEADDVMALAETWNDMANRTNRPAARFYGVLDAIELHDYQTPEGRVQPSAPEIADRFGGGQWRQITDEPFVIDLPAGLQRGWVEPPVAGLDEVAQRLGLDSLPAPVQQSRIERLVEPLVGRWWVSFLLIMVGFALFTTELTSPGSILSGFLSMCCFALFFWLQFLNGTVEMLEIVLFIAGLLAVMAEVFLVPGFGLFGIGGGIMLVVSLLLATQRYLLPLTQADWEDFSSRLLMIVSSITAAAFAFLLLARQLEGSIFIRMLQLRPDTAQEGETADPPQPSPALSAGLGVGATGTTITPCNPYGKARFGDRTVAIRSDDGYLDRGQAIQITRSIGDTYVVARHG